MMLWLRPRFRFRFRFVRRWTVEDEIPIPYSLTRSGSEVFFVDHIVGLFPFQASCLVPDHLFGRSLRWRLGCFPLLIAWNGGYFLKIQRVTLKNEWMDGWEEV